MAAHIVSLDSFGLIKISGPDTFKFLQGQVTCDTESASNSFLLNGAHCNNKGRMIANFSLLKTSDESALLKLPSDLASFLKTRWSKKLKLHSLL